LINRVAIKRLTASDCTLFEEVFRKIGAGNQKSINLNADVLTGQLYPSLAVTAAATENEIALPISIYGPGTKGAHKLSRKIIKNSTYKNWRLDGEFIPGPSDDRTRYDGMQPGDFAVMIFKGEVAPTGMEIILVSKESPPDAALCGELATLFGNRSMIAVSPSQIATAARNVSLKEGHPFYLAASDPEMEAALEDAAQGGVQGTVKLLRNRSGRKVSASDLAKARAKAQSTGQDGEGLINGYFAGQITKGRLAAYKWISAENAISAYDFEIEFVPGQRALVDVKSTNGPFDNIIHISLAEIIEAAGSVPHHIYRVYELAADGGKLKISEDICALAQQLKKIHEETFPTEVRVDSLSIATSFFTWRQDEYVERAEDEETFRDGD
jgi:hypothetical protein